MQIIYSDSYIAIAHRIYVLRKAPLSQRSVTTRRYTHNIQYVIYYPHPAGARQAHSKFFPWLRRWLNLIKSTCTPGVRHSPRWHVGHIFTFTPIFLRRFGRTHVTVRLPPLWCIIGVLPNEKPKTIKGKIINLLIHKPLQYLFVRFVFPTASQARRVY